MAGKTSKGLLLFPVDVDFKKFHDQSTRSAVCSFLYGKLFLAFQHSSIVGGSVSSSISLNVRMHGSACVEECTFTHQVHLL